MSKRSFKTWDLSALAIIWVASRSPSSAFVTGPQSGRRLLAAQRQVGAAGLRGATFCVRTVSVHIGVASASIRRHSGVIYHSVLYPLCGCGEHNFSESGQRTVFGT